MKQFSSQCTDTFVIYAEQTMVYSAVLCDVCEHSMVYALLWSLQGTIRNAKVSRVATCAHERVVFGAIRRGTCKYSKIHIVTQHVLSTELQAHDRQPIRVSAESSAH